MSGPDDAHKYFGEWELVMRKRNIEETPKWQITKETVPKLADDKWYQFRVSITDSNTCLFSVIISFYVEFDRGFCFWHISSY